jgi:NADH-quinone oxidoreductase subunit H
MLSYELSLTLSVVGVPLIGHTLSLAQLVTSLQGTYLVSFRDGIFQPVAFLVYIVSAVAETNRSHLTRGTEQELVAGWHTEYSA